MGSKVLLEFLQMVAATTHFFSLSLLIVIGSALLFWITFFTRFWGITVIYLIWIWVIDIRTPVKGGRRVNWIRGLKLFKYARNYYPVKLSATPGFQLDPKRNYMFCCFPHGLMPVGLSIALKTIWCGVDRLIPNHTIHALTLDANFKFPIFRDYYLSLGICSVKAESINWLLSYPTGGKIAAIVVGGAAEAAYATPGIYKLVLKKRKGFVRLALKNGSPLVPVFSFGEVELFKQLQGSEGSIFERLQNWIKKITGLPMVYFNGRGYFQPYIGLVPHKKPINVVVGRPIEVEKNPNPTEDEIDTLHQTFMAKLNELFEEHKYKYIENPEKTTLIML